jgi:hypothetical protein
MKKCLYLIGALFLLLIGTQSCDKIIADDISEKIPVLILPTMYDTVGMNPIHFKWEAMEGATKYHLQVVSKAFNNIEQYWLDSIITTTDFYYQLDSNEYEMKLTALNGAYESVTLGPIKFYVGVNSTVSNQNVVLTTPQNESYENSSFDNKFDWEPLNGASNYEFSLRKGNAFSSAQILKTANGLSTDTYTYTDGPLTEGHYFWGVKAYIGSTETIYTIGSFYIDTTNPNTPVLSAPTNNATVSLGDVSFIWNNGTDPGTIKAPIHSNFELATDAAFASVVESQDLTSNSVIVSGLDSGTYYWRVTNTDEAGNTSSESAIFTFTIL